MVLQENIAIDKKITVKPRKMGEFSVTTEKISNQNCHLIAIFNQYFNQS